MKGGMLKDKIKKGQAKLDNAYKDIFELKTRIFILLNKPESKCAAEIRKMFDEHMSDEPDLQKVMNEIFIEQEQELEKQDG